MTDRQEDGMYPPTVADIREFLAKYPPDMAVAFFTGPMTEPLVWTSDYAVGGTLAVDITKLP